MDAILKRKAEQLANELATQAQTVDDVNDLLKMLMKSALERMLDTEMDVHLGRKRNAAPADSAVPGGDSESANRRNGIPRRPSAASWERFRSTPRAIAKAPLNPS